MLTLLLKKKLKFFIFRTEKESIQDIGSQLQQRKDETEIKTEEEQFCTTLGDLTPCSSNELEKEEFDKDKPLKKRRGRPRKYPIKISNMVIY